MTTKQNFKSIDFGVVTAVDEFARDKGVPEMVFPKQEKEQAAASTKQPPVPVVAVKSPPKPAAAPSKRLAVELPEYLVRAVADKAHATDSTIRYVVTQALQKAGFYVAPEDLSEDGRRGR